MTANVSQATHESDNREIVFQRLLRAPRELVFKAWTEPQHAAQWWGPQGFTTTVTGENARPDGVWDLVMRDPEGTDSPDRIVFHEVVPPQRLTYTFITGLEGDSAQFEVVMTFEAREQNTLFTMRTLFASVEARAKMAEFGAVEGGNSMLDCLEAHLAHLMEEQGKTDNPTLEHSGRTMQVQPYLFFNGRCEEAIEFYKGALGAEVMELMRFREMKELDDHTPTPPSGEEAIAHASLRMGNDTLVMVSDGMTSSQTNFEGFALSLNASNEDEARRFFAALSEGGQVNMPLMPTAFAPIFGMVADRFGVDWMVITSF